MANIVVIEDDVPVLRLITDTLEVEGFKVQGVGRGTDGVQIVQETLPDLVLCDISMPDLDGYAVLQEVRNSPQTATTPFIFLTARNGREDMRRGMEHGADDYLTKPFTREELLAAIKAQLKKRRILDEQLESTLSTLRRNIIYALPHELRTPLAIILGNAELLVDMHETLRPADVLNMSRAVLRNSRRLHRLIENYLAYAQIELIATDRKQVEALRNHIIRDSGKVIHEQAVEVARQVGRQDDLFVDTCQAALQISRDNLQKIVLELVDNAFKFSQPGQPVHVRSNRSKREFRLCIRDRGRGMTAEQIKQIGAYMQFERTVYEQQGVGLGLVIARRLVELHNGELEVCSAPGKGTTVCIRLPI